MKTFTVGVFEHQGKRSIRLSAYTVWFNPSWEGCCQHTVQAKTGEDAKRFATAVHRTLCMKLKAREK